jgi:hypothetical protein
MTMMMRNHCYTLSKRLWTRTLHNQHLSSPFYPRRPMKFGDLVRLLRSNDIKPKMRPYTTSLYHYFDRKQTRWNEIRAINCDPQVDELDGES